MTQNADFQEKYYTSPDGLRLYYRDYNAANSTGTPLLCLHGLTRNSKDFHAFASALSRDRRVISPDMRGRGRSDYDPDYRNYQVATYARDVLALLDHEQLTRVIAVGTSMGGLISMAIGSVKPDVFRGIILNDVGPEVDPEGIKRISAYVGAGAVLQNWRQAVNGVKVINGPCFPDYAQADWENFARNTFREQQDGSIVADYDQAIGTAIRDSAENAVPADLWPMFRALASVPVMVLRGENSDILSPETLTRMAREHPQLTPVIVPNRGHAPDLSEDVSQREISRFIQQLQD